MQQIINFTQGVRHPGHFISSTKNSGRTFSIFPRLLECGYPFPSPFYRALPQIHLFSSITSGSRVDAPPSHQLNSATGSFLLLHGPPGHPSTDGQARYLLPLWGQDLTIPCAGAL